jgi:benzoyl-CoA reductase/2-hydroxyglutaryl-CoA dehydratase subunit BcrC/BadD/HgdB
MDRVFKLDEQFQLSLNSTKDAINIGWLCTYTPEELIIASGFNPIRILGSKKLNKSESYFPINFCPYLKSSWEALLDAKKTLSAVIFTNSCDGMRRLYDTAEHYLKDIPVYMLDVPRNTDDRAKDFFASNLEDLKVFLESLSGSDLEADKITGAIELMNKKRELLTNFSRLFFDGHTDLIISDYYKIMELSTSSQVNDFISDFEKFIDSLRRKENTRPGPSGEPTTSKDNNIPEVMIIGNLITEEKLWDMLSSIDLRLVSDDLCISSRYYTGLVDNRSREQVNSSTRQEKDKLFRAISNRYLGKPHCMRMADMGAKVAEIEKKVKEDNVRGVIFISLKFCDTMLYSFPLIKQALGKLKIPVLYLEIEYSNFSVGQVKTRTQAFLEML